MIDIVLTFVIVCLLLVVSYLIHEQRLERAKYLNAILSKKPEDMVHMTLADQTKIEVPKETEDPLHDVVDFNEASDEEFNKYIGVSNGKS